MNPLQKTYTELVSFLAVWFNNLKTHTYKVQVTNDKDDKALQAKLQEVVNAVNKLTNSGLSAEVTVDNTPLIKAVNGLRMSLMGTQKVEVTNQKLPKLELPKLLKTEVINLPDKQEVTGTININNFKDLIDGLQVVVDSINDLDLNFKNELKNVGSNIVASSMGSRAALKLWDGTNEVGVTNNALDVNASIDTTGLATDAVDTNTAAIQTAVEAIQAAVEGTLTVTGGGGGVEYTEGDTDASITGSALLWEDTGDTLRAVSAAKPLPISDAGGSITVDGTVAVTNAGITTIAGAVSGTEMQVDVLTMPTTTVTATGLDIRNLTNADVVTAELSAVDNAVLDTIAAKDFATQTTLAAINAKLVTGTDIGDVTINNSTGAAAVNIQDGGNTITVDGTVTANLSATDNAVLDQIELNQDSQTAILTTIDTDTGAMATDLAAIEVLLTGIGADTDAIKTATQLIDNAISGSEMQVDVVAALPAGTNAIGKLAANSGVDIGDVDVTSISAGTNTIGNVGVIPRTSGGLDIFRSLDIDETEEDIKTSAGQLFSISAFNTTAAPLYLKFYNATAANVTVGSTTPVLTFQVPGNADSDGAGFIWNNDIGFAFGTAISVACTTGVADADTGAPGANACIINIGYK